MKAKEHIQSIGKTWWCWVDFKTPEHIMMNLFGEIWLHFHDGIVFFFKDWQLELPFGIQDIHTYNFVEKL